MQTMKLKYVRLAEIEEQQYAMRLDINDQKFIELCESVRKNGVIQPVILKPTGDKYNIAAGHRRTAAARYNNLEVIPAVIAEGDDVQAWNLAFTENLQRKDLSPIEEAASIKDCIESELYTVETIAKMLGRSVGWVVGRLELVNWPAIIQQAVHAERLSVSAARWIAKISDETQVELLTGYAIENGATERATQAWYQSYMATKVTVVPSEVEPLPAGEKVPLPPPASPCVICQAVHLMQDLSYIPVCSACGKEIVELAKRAVPGGAIAGDGGPPT